MGDSGDRGVFTRGVRLVWRYVRRQPVTLSVSLVGATLYAATAVATTVILGEVTNDVIVPAFAGGVPGELVRGGAIALALVGLLRALSIVMRRYMAALTTFRTQAELRRSVTDRYLDVPLSYHRAHPMGELLAHADADVLAATEVINPLPFSLGVVALIIFAIASLLLVDPLLTLVAVVLFPSLALLNRIYTDRVEPRVRQAQEHVGRVSAVAHESFDGALIVKTLGREAIETERLRAAAADLRDSRIQVGRVRAVFEPAIDAIPNLGIVVLLLVGSWQVAGGRMNTGELVQGMALFGLLAFPMRVVGFFLQELPRALVASERIDKVLAEAPAPSPRLSEGLHLPPGALSVELRDVWFGYTPGVSVLEGFTARIEAGEVVAVVGSTGSGKSTLCNLVGRLIDPDDGRVEIGGMDLCRLDSGELREAVAMVFQETFLFADTVRANIGLGRPLSDAEIVAAARAAEADGFIRALPQGYGTVVGERGVTLSGGQRQRVAIARALAGGPRVLVLDDATSSVDPVIEARILESLRSTRNITTIVVAHRVSTIELADRVLYVARGRLVAAGRHRDLLSGEPGYAAIVRAYERAEAAGER